VAAPGNPLGACHCVDIPFLFGTHDVWDAPMLRGAPPDIADVDDLRKIWGAFLHGEAQAADSARTAASTSAKLGFTSAVEPTITVGTVSFPFAT